VDKTWGDLEANGTITGLIGMASRREVHMSITDITMTGNLPSGGIYLTHQNEVTLIFL